MTGHWVLALSLAASAAHSQTANRNKLVFVIPQAVEARPQLTITTKEVDPFRNAADFAAVAGSNASFDRISSGLLRPFNIGIATQLSTLPIASPASGVIFREDVETGVVVPAAESLGTILTERAETIGKRRFYAGFTRQQFRFDRLEGRKLGSLTALDPGGVDTRILQDGARQTTSPTTMGTQIDLRLDQNIVFVTYGLTNRFDVSAAMTWVNATASALAFDAQIHNTGDPFAQGTCWCAQTFDVNLSRQTFEQDFGRSGLVLPGIFGRARASSTGIGDTLLRFKGAVLQGERAALALGADVRLPTGDELDYHGAGAAGFKPFAAVSLHSGKVGPLRLSPNFNAGYQVNGKSVLAGDIFTGRKESLPNAFIWSAGTGVSIADRFTLLTDILGTTLIDATRLTPATVPARGQGIAPASGVAVASGKQTYTMTSGAFGFKVKLAGNMVFTSNMLVAFNDTGLRDRIVPLFGIGYTY